MGRYTNNAATEEYSETSFPGLFTPASSTKAQIDYAPAEFLEWLSEDATEFASASASQVVRVVLHSAALRDLDVAISQRGAPQFENRLIGDSNSSARTRQPLFERWIIPSSWTTRVVSERALPIHLSEDDFVHLSKRDPEKLLSIVTQAQLRPSRLTFAAEALGLLDDSEAVRPVLISLLSHSSPLVREGAIYGLSRHINDAVQVLLDKLAKADPSPGVREAAAEALDSDQ